MSTVYSFNPETTVLRPQLVYRRSINVKIKCYQKLKLNVNLRNKKGK